MGFQNTRLMSESVNETSVNDCSICYEFCVSTCYEFCPDVCQTIPPVVDYPPPSPFPDSGSHSRKPNTFLIVTSTLLATTFLALCCLVYYVYARRRATTARRRSSEAETDETHHEFLYEDHGPIVDHPIWYINTVGLQSSIIRSIAVCKYKRGEGLVEGTECSVCLNEFQEDEALRLLPKCSHAFHIVCIDNWLRSHTNCPMCRAPIVSAAGYRGGASASTEVNNEGSGGGEEVQVVVMEETERGTDGGTSEIREIGGGNEGQDSGTTEDGIQAMNRSVSLDSMAASRITHDNSDDEFGEGPKEPSLRIVPRRVAGTQSLQGTMCRDEPLFMTRSFSYHGKFSLPMSNNKSRDPNPPVRSI